MAHFFEKLLLVSWYGSFQWTRIFWPLTWLYGSIAKSKRQAFLAEKSQVSANSVTNQKKVPVIIVGNITVGGTGKTPVVQTLVAELLNMGLKPGIVSRGYGGQCDNCPHLIQVGDEAGQVGDEPLMLFQSLNIPVVVDPNRNGALQKLLESDVNVVISDDGMQHYKLDRHIEVCVLDGLRGLGNGCLLPVGPLREPESRLNDVDFILRNYGDQSAYKIHSKYSNDTGFNIQPTAWVNVVSGETESFDDLSVAKDALAIAGIGNPQKFFDSLSQIKVAANEKGYPDHYAYSQNDVADWPQQVLMTQKDAVKIKPIAQQLGRNDMWYLQIQAALDETFLSQFKTQLLQIMESNHG